MRDGCVVGKISVTFVINGSYRCEGHFHKIKGCRKTEIQHRLLKPH